MSDPLSLSEFNQLGKLQAQNIKIDKLFGEASYRVYYRITDDKNQSYILMQLPKGIESASEEITNEKNPPKELPFLNIQGFLNSRDLPVPAVIGTDLNRGFILLQDLGNESFENVYHKSNGDLAIFFYQQAIDLMIRLHVTGLKSDPDCIAFSRNFDFKLLYWEFEHFLEYGIEDRLGIKIDGPDRAVMEALGRKLCEGLTQLPYELTHRDFQSRNLMLHGYEFYLIDFQDMLMAPYVYDLVALLRDSYIALAPETIESLIQYFVEKRLAAGLPTPELSEVKQDFYQMTLQRKLKDTGRFQYIKTVKGNDKFLVHVPNSLAYIKDALSRLPEYNELSTLIAKYLKDF